MRRTCQLTNNTVEFLTVHAFIQVEDALNGHVYQMIPCGSDYWFAVPTLKRNIIITANTTGTWNGESKSTPLTLVVKDGICERVAIVQPFCSRRVELQIDGSVGEVGEITISWKCPRKNRCLPKRLHSKELESIRVRFTTKTENLRTILRQYHEHTTNSS